MASHESGRGKKECISSLLRAPFVLREKKYGAMEKENLLLSFLEEQAKATIQFPGSQAGKIRRVLSSGNQGLQTQALQCLERKLSSAKMPFYMGRNGKELPVPALLVSGPVIFSSHPGEPPAEQARSGKWGQLGSSRFPNSTKAAARLLVLPVGEGGSFPRGKAFAWGV